MKIGFDLILDSIVLTYIQTCMRAVVGNAHVILKIVLNVALLS